MRELEHFEQVTVVEWAQRIGRRIFPAFNLLYAVPNGGHRSRAVAGKLKAEGVRAGVSDLCLPARSRGFSGLYLEMKTKTGTLQPNQREFLRDVAAQGFCAAAGYGADHAIEILRWYVGMIDHQPAGIINVDEVAK